MEKIAFKRIFPWIGESFVEWKNGLGNMTLMGVFICLAYLFQLCFFSLFSTCLTGLLGLQGIGVLINSLGSMAMQGIISCMITSVGLARWKGRDAITEDLWQDKATLIQAILGHVTTSIAMSMMAIIGILPGLIPLIMRVGKGGAPDEVQLALALMMMLIIGIPSFLAVYTMRLFVMPLIVDRRLDFWTALTTSIDCVRRDFVGLFAFSFVSLFVLLLIGIAGICTMGAGFIFLVPFVGILEVRVYKDYFGLDPDHVVQGGVSRYEPSYQPAQGVFTGPSIAERPMPPPLRAESQGDGPPPPPSAELLPHFQQGVEDMHEVDLKNKFQKPDDTQE